MVLFFYAIIERLRIFFGMFTVYSKVNCQYCTAVEKLFTLKGIDHNKIILNVDFNRDEFFAKFGDGATFPQVVLDDTQIIGGATDTVAYLKSNKLV
jgi:glutaredoxin 3